MSVVSWLKKLNEQSEERYVPKFMDRVTVLHGFYEGHKGVVIDVRPVLIATVWSEEYKVRFDVVNHEDWVRYGNLEKVAQA